MHNRSITCGRLGQIKKQSLHVYLPSGLKQGNLLNNVFQLAHIAWPSVMEQRFTRIFRENYLRHFIFFGEITSELAGKQSYVVATVAQRWHMDLDCRQPVVEVFAERPSRTAFSMSTFVAATTRRFVF